ncbi:phage late control D family protein [Thiococcus pfennigii]|uniref:phage late control D family protein n=1 Tax=Thiococcus pfennigii TaxID=1057 RepID=UPI0019062AB4|nr:phage late control D family protein [Thiococcus pfennigii]MBK1699383.1 hypothetical protein [Thiococcus pfennigii]
MTAVSLNRLPSYAPDFRILIGGDELPSVVRHAITSVRYEDGIASQALGAGGDEGQDAADRVEIELANVDLQFLQQHIRGLGFPGFPTGIKFGPLRASTAPVTSAPVAAEVAQGAESAAWPVAATAFPNGPPAGPAAAEQCDGLFDIDNRLELDMGYAGGPMRQMFIGEITGVEADFPSSGMPTLKIVAHDYLHRLSEGTLARGFGPLPDFMIATILSAENLLIPLIDPVVAAASSVLDVIFRGTGSKQESESDLQFLKRIADTYDADFWVEGDTLYLSRLLGTDLTPRMTLGWGESLLSFSPRVSTIGKIAGVAIRFTLPLIPIDFTVTVAWDFDRECLEVKVFPCAASVAMKTIAGSMMTVVNRTCNSPADIMSSALLITRMLRSKLNNRLTATASAVGDPQIRAGALVRIEGVGPDFSGDYRVTAASHVIDRSGYRTDFKLRKEIIR